eukprot:8067700-Pyramimonas_sp.AAC.1
MVEEFGGPPMTLPSPSKDCAVTSKTFGLRAASVRALVSLPAPPPSARPETMSIASDRSARWRPIRRSM